jgi:hypothetical protein
LSAAAKAGAVGSPGIVAVTVVMEDVGVKSRGGEFEDGEENGGRI